MAKLFVTPMKLENTQVQMRKGILEFCILEIIARGEAYASDMLEELTSARMIVVEGTLYPLLTRLKNAALLDYVWKESTSGPPRKYYPDRCRPPVSGRTARHLGGNGHLGGHHPAQCSDQASCLI